MSEKKKTQTVEAYVSEQIWAELAAMGGDILEQGRWLLKVVKRLRGDAASLEFLNSNRALIEDGFPRLQFNEGEFLNYIIKTLEVLSSQDKMKIKNAVEATGNRIGKKRRNDFVWLINYLPEFIELKKQQKRIK